MAIQRTKKQSDLEKRLQLLHRQVYGRGSDTSIRPHADIPTHRPTDTLTYRYTDTPIHRSASPAISDISFLHQDLLKILLFSSLAIGIQLLIFFLSKNHILNLNFL